MATEILSMPTTTTATIAGLVVAGLGAVYAYTQLGLPWSGPDDTRAHTGANPSGDGEPRANKGKEKVTASTSEDGKMGRKGRKRGKGRGKGRGRDADVGGGEDKSEGEGEGRDGDKATGKVTATNLPGDFDGASSDARVDVAAQVGSPKGLPTGTASQPGNDAKLKVKKQKQRKTKKRQGKGLHGDADGYEDDEVGSETGGEVGVGRIVAYGPRSGESTDASASLAPSVSGSALGSSRAMGKGHAHPPAQPHAQARVHAPSQPREIRSSLSLDTDSSWTHVDRRRLGASESIDERARRSADAVDAMSSDLASTASNSPVMGRMEVDMRGTRADLAQRTLAEKPVLKPRNTDADGMLGKPDFPALARVLRVRPRADETPVPGFSWEDYGDVVEDSLLVHDADQEDEGEWGIVKSRSRTRLAHTTITASMSNSTSPVAAPETMTKKQRQNARKRELAKVAKAEAETARLEGLAKHQRELERLRIIEHSREGGGKIPSGGMQASVDDRGKLIWE